MCSLLKGCFLSTVSWDWFQASVLLTLKLFAWIHLNNSTHYLLPHGTNSVSKQIWKYLRSFPVSWATTIINNTLNKSFLLPYINDKSEIRLSLLIRPFSSLTKFNAKHDRVPHVLRDDGENAMWCNDQRRLCNIISIIVRLFHRLSWISWMLGQVS